MNLKHVLGSIAMVWVLASCSGGGSQARDAAASDDALGPLDAAIHDAASSAIDAPARDASVETTPDTGGAGICARMGWLNADFVCTDGAHLSCMVQSPGMYGAGTCDLHCTASVGSWGDYGGFGSASPDSVPTDIALHAPTSFDERFEPMRTCTRM